MNLELIEKQPLQNILRYSIPSIIAMILSSFVTIIDGYFVSKVIGKDALAAINLGLPMLFVFLAVGIMIGVGGVSLAGRRLGEKSIDKSINGFNQTLVTGIITFIFLSIFFALIIKPIIYHVGLNSNTIDTMKSYYSIMLWVYPFMMLNIIFGMFIRCEGKPNLFMINTIITTVLNILLDYVFIMVLQQGIKGAAYASGIAVIVGTLIMVKYFINSKTLFLFKKFEFIKADLKQTLTNGSSEFIGQLSASITLFFINVVIMKRMGLIGVAGMTIIGYSRYIYNMIVVGFCQGISPIISYSFGANKHDIGVKLRKYTSRIVLFLGVAFYVVLNIGSTHYGSIFTNDTKLITLVAYGLKIFSFSFIIAGYNDITSGYFTSIGYAKQSAIISSLKGLVLLMLNIFLLPALFGNTGIWLIAPVTEIGTFFIALYFLRTTLLPNCIKI
ncbi:multidrug efflux MATE transporter CdeA [Clostridium sediminicola]|uniref:MATE family efflux transporter n=1 Tax=Clostridium sediminicola TaxID=3114879 RepID=UPI0031F2141B